MNTRMSRFAAVCVLCGFLPLFTSCGDSTKKAVVTPTPSVNGYFAMGTEAVTNSDSVLSSGYVFTLDHTASTFAQDDVSSGTQKPVSSGSFTSANGFLIPALNPYNGATVTTPEGGNWVLEQPGVMGFAYISSPATKGLIQVAGSAQGLGDTSQNVIPFATNAACPSIAKSQTFEFLTVPGAFGNSQSSWNYQSDTAYGTVQISTTQAGAVLNLAGIQQYLLPGTSVSTSTPVTLNPGPVDISGVCGPSSDGYVDSVSYVDSQGVSHIAELNVASGFLLENNTEIGGEADQVSNILGAGYGAVGLAVPSSQVSTSSLVGNNFQGFIYAPATTTTGNGSYSTTAAFSGGASGCAAFQSSLASLATHPSANTVYGGEFAGNNPSANSTASCDFAIDLGTQDSSTNGLFPNATIYVGSAFPLNNPALPSGGPGTPYTMPAVAITGQINGKNAIFVLEEDLNLSGGQAVGIYLIQSGQ